jgi:3-oxoisoapionate kinase
MASAHPLIAFYGDDFTGSTDALDSAARAGARSALFLDPPSAAQLARYPGIQVIGVAGGTRSLGPSEMEAELRPALAALRALGPRHLHYKVCSTFDSSPSIGSIGRAIDIGASVCGGPFVPLLVGAPYLGRYCVFGNLFARMGTGSTGRVYRLDRHPSMSRHPVTPMDEADLRLHLARQTDKRTGLFDVVQLGLPAESRPGALQALIDEGHEVILFDAVSDSQLAVIGGLIDGHTGPGSTLFSVGSSGIEAALGAVWAGQGLLHPPASWPEPGPAEPLLVVSGSCSPVTERQISHALERGFAEVPLDAAALAGGPDAEAALRRIEATVAGHLREGRNIIVHTCRGSADPRLASGADAFRRGGADATTRTARVLGAALGRIVASAVAGEGIGRAVVAGGDTSTYAARAMGIEALEMLAPLVTGAPLCVVRAPGRAVDGLEVSFKGGQVGEVDYFERIARGARSPTAAA